MKTSMLVMLVMLVVACAGCGPVEFPFELYVDSGFSLEEQCLAVEAVERWKEASSLIDVDVIIADGVREKDEHVVIKAGQNDASEVGAGPEHMGWTEPSGEMFLWSDKVRSNGGNFAENFMGVAAHEFGHHIGLHHDGAKSALMYRKVPTWCVTQRDLDQFCRQRGCSEIAPPCRPPPDCSGWGRDWSAEPPPLVSDDGGLTWHAEEPQSSCGSSE